MILFYTLEQKLIRFKEPMILFVAYFDGFVIDSPAALFAAKCITQSNLFLQKARDRSELDNVDP